ncbi:class I SAM-dependent methyltransferase [Ochrobactrum teleogrylli]|uniref:class I SAM-dependent methyltransferase n=1 Tax=Ochrobactrum teleogrylli TaxID=2479765 RepID=UPI00384E479C
MRKADQFDEKYFQTGFGPNAYARTEPWLNFYANIVDQLVRSIRPRTVLDAGCALGMIVEALWDRGVEAKGIDISDFAINNVRPDMREHCTVGSLTAPIDGQYDLIVCIEVLEHMPAEDAKIAIMNFASATNSVLFSSTPHDFEEVTHVNVRPTLSWLKQFMEAGLVPDLTYDASYITPHAILFKKGEHLSDDVLTLVSEHLRLKHIINEKTQAYIAQKQISDSALSGLQIQLDAKEIQLHSALQVRHEDRNSYLEIVRNLEQQINQSENLSTIARERHSSEILQLNSQLNHLNEQIQRIKNSSSWRLTAPIRTVSKKLPPKALQHIRRVAKAGYWAVTPHRLPARIKFIKNRNTAQLALDNKHFPESSHDTEKPSSITSRSSRNLIDQQFSDLAPLPIFRDPASDRTLTVLTDSVDHNSLFGGVGTALIAGLLLAEKLGARFRLATRSNRPDPSIIGTIMKAHNIKFEGTTDFVHVPLNQLNPLSMGDDDIVLTTSWWGTHAALGSLEAKRIIYILQEDERMFYPYNDMRLKCSEVLSRPGVSLLVNTNLLYTHLQDGNEPVTAFENRAVAFEPAFPTFPRPDQIVQNGKKKFFFYARPNHARNLYWRGIEVLDGAMRQGLLSADEWEVNFVGHHVEPIELPGGILPKVWSQMSWLEYAQLVSTMDLGFSLMDTPHPSYPPLDLAASGSIVVTNQHGIKKDLSCFSKNIITAKSDVGSLIEALKLGVDKASKLTERYTNCQNDHIERDWRQTLGSAIDRLLEMRRT